MLKLFILIALSCSINSIWADTPFKDCGSELGTIQSFTVTDCPTAPCKFEKGKTYAMNLTFTAKAPSKTASVSIHGVIGGIPVPFPLPDPDACKMNVKCPVNQNDKNEASMSLPVLSSYPSISLYVKIEIKADDQHQDYACLTFPATITSGSGHKRNLVGWKKGKLFEMLD
ncbi:unnamed protein product [Rotaria sordida]|uniref:MD-2-related lipid-recognition domain-containing protein n=1 Tax=Rotaria sordida TaxID=392033 RepID=A0A814HE42_9BILA|nr:unnamed protein product [Rotaria sordida]CAF1009613.1 unnamed protein product [Rotaria sordida]CAF1113934.1 unnamed protein product [Rotaria sordida]CAF1118027.1 unnamed protein product [Rotaria sordida]